MIVDAEGIPADPLEKQEEGEPSTTFEQRLQGDRRGDPAQEASQLRVPPRHAEQAVATNLQAAQLWTDRNRKVAISAPRLPRAAPGIPSAGNPKVPKTRR